MDINSSLPFLKARCSDCYSLLLTKCELKSNIRNVFLSCKDCKMQQQSKFMDRVGKTGNGASDCPFWFKWGFVSIFE